MMLILRLFHRSGFKLVLLFMDMKNKSRKQSNYLRIYMIYVVQFSLKPTHTGEEKYRNFTMTDDNKTNQQHL